MRTKARRMTLRYLAMGVSAVAAAGALLIGSTGGAVAAPGENTRFRTASTGAVTPATYNNACGAGYIVKETLPLTGGHVYLTYDSSNGYNCVVTVRNSPGAATHMIAAIRLSYTESSPPGNWVIQDGNYTTYAGPVYLHAPGHCIDWYGQIGTAQATEYNSHCG
jgi:hypothetical protein